MWKYKSHTVELPKSHLLFELTGGKSKKLFRRGESLRNYWTFWRILWSWNSSETIEKTLVRTLLERNLPRGTEKSLKKLSGRNSSEAILRKELLLLSARTLKLSNWTSPNERRPGWPKVCSINFQQFAVHAFIVGECPIGSWMRVPNG